MRYAIEFTPTAVKDLKALPKAILKKIDARIALLADDPQPKGVKKLQGCEELYRVRVGDYRIVYTMENGKLTIVIVRIGHRKEIYRLLKR
jgi:mRNA interferase RelE/StbE